MELHCASINNEEKIALTPKEAAKLIGCSEYTIKQLAREKKIPHYRIGVRMLFTKSSMEKWISVQERRNFIFE